MYLSIANGNSTFPMVDTENNRRKVDEKIVNFGNQNHKKLSEYPHTNRAFHASGADATVYVRLLLQISGPETHTYTVASAPIDQGSFFYAEVQISFGTVCVPGQQLIASN